MQEERTRIDEAVELLLRPPTPDQRALLSAVCEPFLERGLWPVFDFVESVLDEEGFDATAVLNTFPSWHSRYSAVWPGPGAFVRPEDHVALTVPGLGLCAQFSEQAAHVVDSYLALLRHLASRFRSTPGDPSSARRVEVTSGDVSSMLTEAGLLSASDEPVLRLTQLRSVMDHEPTGWRAALHEPEAGEWSVQIGSPIRKFLHVQTLGHYLECLAEPLFAMRPRPAPAYLSSLGLPEAIDYLDAVWRLRFGNHLFRLPGATKTAKLSLPAETSDEYEARLSALADVFRRLLVREGTDSSADRARGPLNELGEFVRSQLPDESWPRINDAVGTLRAINDLRRSRQHHGIEREAIGASTLLGVPYPPGDWSSAWGQIQSRAVEALNAIREEIQASDE